METILLFSNDYFRCKPEEVNYVEFEAPTWSEALT